MAIENEDWFILGGAAAGGALLGALGHWLLSPGPDLVYTGLARKFEFGAAQGVEKDVVAASVWAQPEGGYSVVFETPVDKEGHAVDAFPEMERPVFQWPFAAALWADDVMERLDFVPLEPWAGLIREASESRIKERAKKPLALPAPETA